MYHNCLMKMSMELSRGSGEITAEDSLWMTIAQEDCNELIISLIEEAVGYRRGLMSSGAAEIYKKERIKKVCRQVAWVLINHVRQGMIRRVEFEAEFGAGEG